MNIKKILLSGMVVLAFFAYTWQQRHDKSAPVVAPASSQPSQSASDSYQTTASQNTSTPDSTAQTPAKYKDGSFTGSAANAIYGYIQVLAIIKGGRITDVQFLQYPNDRRNSIEINQQAMPYLKQEAIQAQGANVDIISGATDTSSAFRESLSAALAGAQS